MTKPRVAFMGTGEIGLPVLRWLRQAPSVELVALVTQPDRPVGRSQVLTPPGPKKEVSGSGVRVFQPERLRRSPAVDELRQLRPDLIVVMAYGQILPKAVLELPSLACLNLHASLLPKHRGAAPIQAALLAGDRETGITVMHMAESLDTGDIVLEKKFRIRRRDTGADVHDRLADLAPVALAEALELLLAGKAPRVPQVEEEATYAAKLDRDSGRIDWQQDCWCLDRLVRAMYSWPGAYTEIQLPGDGNGPRRLKVQRALPVHRRKGSPGTVLGVSPRGILVACGAGALLLKQVQLEGKRQLPAAEFARGIRLQAGQLLGPQPGEPDQKNG
ncbi:MAG: methionyl-tRNA formyltransferase [Verrucomicrobia bacterium]|nr:methionyl-tRNA formyltransferase [Verrucomicrobiota bacterium]